MGARITEAFRHAIFAAEQYEVLTQRPDLEWLIGQLSTGGHRVPEIDVHGFTSCSTKIPLKKFDCRIRPCCAGLATRGVALIKFATDWLTDAVDSKVYHRRPPCVTANQTALQHNYRPDISAAQRGNNRGVKLSLSRAGCECT
jgi:hypothetical protein